MLGQNHRTEPQGAGSLELVNKSQGLAPRHRKFAMHYLHSLNATEAARRAGYQGENLAAIGSRLLRRESVKAFLSEHLQEAMSADRVLLKAMILRLWQEFMDNPEQHPMIRLKASENLAKYCGLFEQGQKLGGPVPEIVYLEWPAEFREG